MREADLAAQSQPFRSSSPSALSRAAASALIVPSRCKATSSSRTSAWRCRLRSGPPRR